MIARGEAAPAPAAARDQYRLAAAFYDLLARVYSGGQIQACKTAFVSRIRPGERVLIAGAGQGRDALAAARRGAEVTAVDLSRAMLERARRHLLRSPDLRVELVHGDVLRLSEDRRYSWVIANFFLNLFREPEARALLGKLAGLTESGGRMVIGDFAPPHGGSWGTRALQTLNWRLPNTVFSFVAGDARHAFYDYVPFAEDAGLKPLEILEFRPLAWTPPCYRSILLEKV